jgi:hypothetical protein
MSDNNVSVDTKEELEFTVKKAKQDILAWKAHLLRNINQDEARLDIIEALKRNINLAGGRLGHEIYPTKIKEESNGLVWQERTPRGTSQWPHAEHPILSNWK